MKKSLIGITLGLAVLGGSVVYAGMGCNGGPGMFGPNADLEKVRTFQKETGTQRDEMMIKRFELSQELDKATPDKSRVEALRKEMIELRSKLQESATKLGLTGGCLTECNEDPVDCLQSNCNKHKKTGKKGKEQAGCNKCRN